VIHEHNQFTQLEHDKVVQIHPFPSHSNSQQEQYRRIVSSYQAGEKSRRLASCNQSEQQLIKID
jgi:hypothetical protein